MSERVRELLPWVRKAAAAPRVGILGCSYGAFVAANQLLKAYALFEKDVEYVIIDNKIKIVDEQTGRILEFLVRVAGGLQQASRRRGKRWCGSVPRPLA